MKKVDCLDAGWAVKWVVQKALRKAVLMEGQWVDWTAHWTAALMAFR